MAEAVALVGGRICIFVEGPGAVRLFVVLDKDPKQDDESHLDCQ